MDYAVNMGLVCGYTFYKIKYFWKKNNDCGADEAFS